MGSVDPCELSHLILGRAVEIPCPTCPTWSHIIQDKLKISFFLVFGQMQMYKSKYNSAYHILIYYYEFTCCIENIVDPDQLAY